MTRIRPFLAVAVLPALVALVLACAAIAHACTAHPVPHPDHYATSQVGAEVCFPFRLWSLHSIDGAPCDIITAPQEDGSGRLYLGTVANDLAECVIPNPREERGAFVIQCHRVGRGNR